MIPGGDFGGGDEQAGEPLADTFTLEEGVVGGANESGQAAGLGEDTGSEIMPLNGAQQR